MRKTFVGLTVAMATLAGQWGWAQEPAPSVAPQAVNVAPRIVPDGSGGYQCYKLDATVELQYVYIDMPSRRITFWGARVLNLGPASPLHAIGIEVGDVITRLDRIPVATRAFQRQTPTGEWVWHLPEMDRHYSYTHVRFVKAGTNTIQELVADFGPLGVGGFPPGGPGPIPVPAAAPASVDAAPQPAPVPATPAVPTLTP